jgi:hypothetical protein
VRANFHGDCPLLDRTTFADDDRNSESQGLFMEELYKGLAIQVTVEKDNGSLWKPICKILDGESREFITQLDWLLGYDTSDRVKKVGLLVSKK